MTERLYRSEREKILGGVCGGLADYFMVDVTLVRLLAVLSILAGGIGVVVYIAAWYLLPVDPAFDNVGNAEAFTQEGNESARQDEPSAHRESEKRKYEVIGIGLVALGCLFLAEKWFPWLSFAKLWPLFLILIGVGVIWRGER